MRGATLMAFRLSKGVHFFVLSPRWFVLLNKSWEGRCFREMQECIWEGAVSG